MISLKETSLAMLKCILIFRRLIENWQRSEAGTLPAVRKSQ